MNMIDKLMVVALVVVIATNFKIFISELKREFEFNKMNLRLSMLLDELEKELKEEIAKQKVEKSTEEEPKKRRGRPKKEEEK